MPAVETAIYASISKVCFEKIFPDIKETVFNFGKKKSAEKAIPMYLQKLLIKNHYMQSLLFDDGKIPFDDLYQEQYVRRPNHMHKPIIFKSCTEMFASYKAIIIRGDAGLGKSSLAKFIVRNSIKENFKIPFIIELRNYDPKMKFEDILRENFSTLSESKDVPIEFINECLKQGKFIILFDGFDEIKLENISKVSLEIDKFNSRYNKCPMVILGRPYSHVENFINFQLLQLCSFTDKDVNQFIEKISKFQDQEFIKNLKKAIKSAENTHFKDYLTNPLLLSAYIISFKHHTSSVPTQLSSFYSEVTEALFLRHDKTTKNAFERTLDSGLNKDKVKSFLEHFSLIVTAQDKFEFTQDYCEQLFQRLNRSKQFKCDFENLKNDLLKSLAIWIKEGIHYKFFHRSIQEYFFSRAISKLSLEKKISYYTQLRTEDDKKYISNFSLRLQLLEDIDPFCFKKYLLIPFCDELIKKLSVKSKSVTYYLEHISGRKIFKGFQHQGEMVPLTMYTPTVKHVVSNYILRKIPKSSQLINEVEIHLHKSMEKFLTDNNIESPKHTFNIIDVIDRTVLSKHIDTNVELLKELKEQLNKEIQMNSFDDLLTEFDI